MEAAQAVQNPSGSISLPLHSILPQSILQLSQKAPNAAVKALQDTGSFSLEEK